MEISLKEAEEGRPEEHHEVFFFLEHIGVCTDTTIILYLEKYSLHHWRNNNPTAGPTGQPVFEVQSPLYT